MKVPDHPADPYLVLRSKSGALQLQPRPKARYLTAPKLGAMRRKAVQYVFVLSLTSPHERILIDFSMRPTRGEKSCPFTTSTVAPDYSIQ